MKNDINAIYYLVDEFCKIYRQWQKHRLIGEGGKTRLRDNLMSLSEMLTVMISSTTRHLAASLNSFICTA